MGTGTIDTSEPPPHDATHPFVGSDGVDRWLRKTLAAGVVLWALIPLAAVFVMTAGTDETWVLHGVRSLLRPASAEYSTPLVVTSGGLNTVVHLAIEWLAGNRVWLHRLPSLVALAAVFTWIYRGARRRGAEAGAAWVAVAPLIGIPGTAEVGTTALGTSIALALLLWASALWANAGDRPGPWRVVAAGSLFGLAAAARTELILFSVVLYLLAILGAPRPASIRGWLPRPTLLVIGVGLAVVALSFQAHRALTPAVALQPVAHLATPIGADGSPLSSFRNYPAMLNRWLAGEAFVGLPWLVVASVVPFLIDTSGPRSSGRRLRLILLFMGWAIWGFWHLRAPIPHLRYLWIGLACFAMLMGYGLERACAWARGTGRRRVETACLLVALAFVVAGIGSGIRSLAMGESDYASWEWSREMGADYFRRFVSARDQRDAMAYLRDRVPASEAIVCIGPPHPIRYLADREAVDFSEYRPEGPSPVHLVLTPAVGTYFYMPPQTYEWIARHARLEAEFGRYSVYELGPEEMGALARLGPLPRTNYIGHPLSSSWFGREGLPSEGSPPAFDRAGR